MFRNRGQIPNIDTNGGKIEGYRPLYRSHYWWRRYIIKYDKTFVIMEIVSALLIFLIVLAVYLFAYPISFDDPLATMKNNFLTAQLIAIIGSLVMMVAVTFFTKSKEKLIRNLRIVGLFSLTILIVLVLAKLNMDATYNKEEKFEEFYEQYEAKDNETQNSNKMDLKLSGMKLLNRKEAYKEESKNAYTNFSVKVMLYITVQMAIIAITFFLSHRVSARERKKEKLTKDDAILFDEEENIKY